ncbi:MAG: fluoride efflux transporter CrcB [Lentisphaerota bacterium]
MLKYLCIFLGGGAGSVCRYLVSALMGHISHTSFPPGTLTVNLIGSFIIGALFELFNRFVVPTELRLLLTTGFLGGFTTFSSFALDNTVLYESSKYYSLLQDILVHNIAGILCVIGGIMLVKILLKRNQLT